MDTHIYIGVDRIDRFLIPFCRTPFPFRNVRLKRISTTKRGQVYV